MLMELDKIDKQILNLLQQNSRITTKEISDKLGLTKTPIYERIKKLEKRGIIKSYNALINHKKIDKNLIVYISVLLHRHTREVINAFVDKINSFPEVLECYYISGNSDFLLKVFCKDMDDYHEFIMNKFSIIDNVNRFYSSFVLKESKQAGVFIL